MSSSMAQAWHGLLISTGTQPRVDEKKRKPSHTRHHVGIERQTTSTVAAWDYWSKYNKRKHVFPSSVFLYLVLVYPPLSGVHFFFLISGVSFRFVSFYYCFYYFYCVPCCRVRLFATMLFFLSVSCSSLQLLLLCTSDTYIPYHLAPAAGRPGSFFCVASTRVHPDVPRDS